MTRRTAFITGGGMAALESGKLETYVPYTDSLTTRLLGAFPWLIRRVEPRFAAVGERGRRRYLARHGLVPAAPAPTPATATSATTR